MTGELESVWGFTPADAETRGRLDAAVADAAVVRAPSAVAPPSIVLAAPFGWTDGLTDTDGPRMWEKVVKSEQSRNARHRRTSTIVLVEVLGLDSAAERWGAALSLQLFVELARELSKGIRSSDHIARVQSARFGVLLTETDEISAINFVDRIKARCCETFDPVAKGLRLAVGWASPPVGGDLAEALRVAEERLAEAISREG
jgi:diguanylate cyclase (GGDEF)-like protein